MVTFALIFFVIIALAVLISVTNSFRDTEEDRFHRSNYGNPHNQYPDQHRYDDPDHHGNYGYNPPIIIQTTPYDPYGGSHRRGNYEPRSSFPLGLLIIVAVAFFWFYSGDQKMKSGKNAEAVEASGQKEQPSKSARLKGIEEQRFEPKQTSINEQPDADINGIEAPVANWFTIVSRYNSAIPAREAMKMVSKTIDLQGKSVYYGPSPYGGWVVYIPAVSEIQALDFKQQILDHAAELDAYCPGTPKVIPGQ